MLDQLLIKVIYPYPIILIIGIKKMY